MPPVLRSALRAGGATPAAPPAPTRAVPGAAAFPLPRDPGCPCGRGGVCAPQRGVTHAEYSQIVRARIAVHRQAASSRPGASHSDRSYPSDADARDRADAPAPRTDTRETPREPAIADLPIGEAFDTGVVPKRPCRRVRRYAAWYDGGVPLPAGDARSALRASVWVDERVVAGVERRSGEWRRAAEKDAKTVVQRLATRGYARLAVGATTIDRRPKNGNDGVVRAEALCVYARGGTVKRASAAHCVTLTDERGRTLGGLIYLPIEDE